MMGFAGSQGPMTTFLYRCKLISHQLQQPIIKAVDGLPMKIPIMAPESPPLNVIPTDALANRTKATVRATCPRHE